MWYGTVTSSVECSLWFVCRLLRGGWPFLSVLLWLISSQEFLQAAQRELEFWKDSSTLMSIIRRPDQKEITFRKIAFVIQDWLTASSSQRLTLMSQVRSLYKAAAAATAAAGGGAGGGAVVEQSVRGMQFDVHGNPL